MLKLIVLILGLGVGFGGGVYWAHHNPEAAAKFSEEEERRFLEAQLAISQKIQEKLAELSARTGGKTPGAGFLSSGQSGAAAAADVKELQSEAEAQEQALKQRIEQLKK